MIPAPETPATPTKAPSLTALKAMYAAESSPSPDLDTETPPETPEPEASKPEEKTTEAAKGTAPATQPEKVEEEEEFELPKWAEKRIEREAKKQAFFQSKIDHSISARKAKEAEAAKLTEGKGPEPVKTEPAENARPTMPDDMPDITTFQGTSEEFKAASDKWKASVLKHQEDYQKWLEGETRKTVTSEIAQQQAKKEAKERWDAAIKEHGEEFSGLMDTLAASMPEPLQLAVSKLKTWDRVAMHLAKTPEELAPLVSMFESDPLTAAFELGKLEERLKPAAPIKTEEKPAEKVLPPPLKPVGGNATATGAVDISKIKNQKVFNKEITRMLEAS